MKRALWKMVIWQPPDDRICQAMKPEKEKRRMSMNTLKTLNSRRSIRTFTGEKVPNESMEKILQAAKAAPVAMGEYQNVHLTVIENKKLLEDIDAEAARRFGDPNLHPLYNAPSMIVVSSKLDGGKLDRVEYSNTAIIAHSIGIAATELSIGNCYIWGVFMAMGMDKKFFSSLGIPEGFAPCCGVVLGTTDEKFQEREIPSDRISVNYMK